MKSQYVINVQILRFFAALLVALVHIGINIGDREAAAGRTFAMAYPFDWGLGVDIFFIISGFIMYYLMHSRFRQPGVARDFLLRRLLRIAPLYWLTTTMTLLAIVIAAGVINHSTLDPVHVFASYLFLPWPRADGELFPVLSLGWTLNYEMFFYFVFAAALMLPKRIGLVLLAAVFVMLAVAAPLTPSGWWLLRFWGNSIILEFLIGIWLAHLFISDMRMPRWMSAALVAVGIVAACVFFQTGSYNTLPRVLTGGLPALLIASAFILSPQASAQKPYTWLAIGGDASYALYLTHPFAAKVVAVFGVKLGLPPILIFPIAIAACVALSLMAHFLFEKPVGTYLQRRFGRRPQANAAAPG